MSINILLSTIYTLDSAALLLLLVFDRLIGEYIEDACKMVQYNATLS